MNLASSWGIAAGGPEGLPAIKLEGGIWYTLEVMFRLLDKTLWHKYIRYFVLNSFLILSVVIYFYYKAAIPDRELQTIRLTQAYALWSLGLLYASLLPGPLYEAFPRLLGKVLYIRARRAIGVSAFYYGLLHSFISFFGQFGGFAGLSFLSNGYLTAVALGFAGLAILSLLALTSFDYWVNRLGRYWKLLHRLIYVAAWLILAHTFLIGTHFSSLSKAPSQLLAIAVALLLILEALRIDKYLVKRFSLHTLYSFNFVILFALIVIGFYSFLPTGGSGSLNIHALHIQLAKQTQQGVTATNNLPAIPGLVGDRTKRYSVNFKHEDNITPNKENTLSFQVFDANNGKEVVLFANNYEKLAHLVIVDSKLEYFNHIHPTFSNSQFSIATQFPHDGEYHLYLSFQPIGAIEQQFAFTVNVGSTNADKPSQKIDTELTKTFGQYKVTLTLPKILKATELSVGNQRLKFDLTDTNEQPVTNLKPYLAAFGHLVMINQETFDYLHIHPTNLTPPPPSASGGPSVEFMPLGLYGPIKPGIYRLFAQFNPNNQLILADFTIKVE